MAVMIAHFITHSTLELGNLFGEHRSVNLQIVGVTAHTPFSGGFGLDYFGLSYFGLKIKNICVQQNKKE